MPEHPLPVPEQDHPFGHLTPDARKIRSTFLSTVTANVLLLFVLFLHQHSNHIRYDYLCNNLLSYR